MATPTGPAPVPAPKKPNTAGGLGCLIVLGILIWAIIPHGSGLTSPGSPATIRPAAAVLLDLRGNGIKKSTPFTTSGPWTLGYAFDCSSFGDTGNFIVTVFGTDGTIRDLAVNELAGKGNSTTQGYATGDLYLEMNSECSWSVRVTG